MAKSRGHALRTFVIRRLLLMIPTLIGVSFFVFVLCQFVPGGPIDQFKMKLAGGDTGGETGGGSGANVQAGSRFDIPEDHLKTLREYYGFDKPVAQRYFHYVGKLARGDFGTSFRFTEPVMDLIVARFPISLFYGGITALLTYIVCIPLGVAKALKHRTVFDTSSSVLVFVGYAIPGYALGAVLLALFAVQRDWFPLAGFHSAQFDTLSTWAKTKDIAHHAVLPLICYAIHLFAVMTILMKNSLMENMSADYVKTALAKGMTWPRAVFLHAFRNSLIPIATGIGSLITILLAGSLLIERVFGIPGMGLLFFESIQARDYPVVMGFTVIGSVLLLVGNLLSDLAVAIVDPRVRFGE